MHPFHKFVTAPARARIVTILCAAALFGNSLPAVAQTGLAPRPPAEKRSLEKLRQMPGSQRVVVKFNEGIKVRLNKTGRLSGLPQADITSIVILLGNLGIPARAIKRMHARAEDEIDTERQAAERESGGKLADLNLYFVIDLPAGVDAAVVADKLNQMKSVEYAEPAAIPAPPPFDIAPATDNFKSEQGYLRRAPNGIGALPRSRYKGAWGKALTVTDVEYSWQTDHEDLEIQSVPILTNGETASDPFNDNNHGTAVLGEIVARNNGYGVTGIAPDARLLLAPVNTVESSYSPARAINIATGSMKRGDVMVIEQQYWACGASTDSDIYGPLEELQDVFDAISVATAKGIVVVEAAGNGGINLDSPSCNSRYNRNFRDSGAIIVGAGSIGRAKLSFSSFGSRVDVQGWGESVMTTGYGDAFFPNSDARQKYTRTFGGTSSATPIVAGAALQVNGIIKACGIRPLSSRSMRKILTSTGSQQSDPINGNIGPLPSIKAAVRRTNAKTCFDLQ